MDDLQRKHDVEEQKNLKNEQLDMCRKDSTGEGLTTNQGVKVSNTDYLLIRSINAALLC